MHQFFIYLCLIFIFACTSSSKNTEQEKSNKKLNPEISLEDIQGFWVNSIFVDSILTERTFSKYGYGSFFFLKSLETDGNYTLLRKGPFAGSKMKCVIDGKKIIIADSNYSSQVWLVSDSILAFSNEGDTNAVAFFKRRNNWREILNRDDCPNDLGLYGGCGYVRLFSKLVFDGTYDVLLTKSNFNKSSNEVNIENGIVTGIEKFPIELYFDNYFGTIHPNRKNDAIYFVRDSTCHKSYHWRFSGDTLILHEWILNRDQDGWSSQEHFVGEEVLRMVKRK
jgi:hypothetical protein